VQQKSGWTIVRKSTEIRVSAEEKEEAKVEEGVDDADDESEMVVGELEQEGTVESTVKPSQDQVFIRDDVDEILNDPLHGVRHRSFKRGDKSPRRDQSPDLSVDKETSEKLMRERSIRTNRRHKFVDCLSGQDVNIAALRKLAWAGIPSDMRPMAWQLLLGYLPLPTPLRSSTLARKRGEYLSLVELAFARDREGLDQQIWHQIEIDVPRTRPGVPLWMQMSTQRVCLLPFVTTRKAECGNTEPGADIIRLGHPPSGQRICPGDKRPCHTVLSNFFIRLH
jgi:hypothetical protein